MLLQNHHHAVACLFTLILLTGIKFIVLKSYLFYSSWLPVYVYVDFGTHETNKLW
jgi:hypothetical protein